VMPADRVAVTSLDLVGFHFYGSDICLQAEMAGGNAYVISFLLHHHGNGDKGISYRQQRRNLSRKYGRFFPGRALSTTTAVITLG
jgi:hypothetical protein